MNPRRRSVLLVATAAVTGAQGLPSPSIGQGARELKMVTDWPANSLGPGTSAARLAESITALSDGRLKITVYPAGSLVRAFETFDAVSNGIADMYHSADFYFSNKSPALDFFCAIPNGMTADELTSWIYFGGGQQLWDEVAAPFAIKPLLVSHSGVQMGGWFNREVSSPIDFKGLRYRMPGLGGEVLRRMGATVVTLPPGQIVSAIKTGAIDATKWVCPWLDVSLGLDKVADYYYYPGFHDPDATLTLGINRKVWDGLSDTDRVILETAAAAEASRTLAEYNAQNIKWLRVLRADKRIKIRRFSDELIRAFGKLSKEVLLDAASKDPMTRKVYESYTAFLAGSMDWGELSETGYRDARRIALAES